LLIFCPPLFGSFDVSEVSLQTIPHSRTRDLSGMGSRRNSAKHNIIADVEVIPIQKINEAFERMLRSDVMYRFSIDMRSLSRAA
jgi:D-arabinose 1-dehydrogenase-like Zn-dependent alcohol dehydrogenase